MKHINEAVDEVRRGAVEAEPLLRKARYALLKNRENITEKQRQRRHKKGFASTIYKWYWRASLSRIQPMAAVARTVRKNGLGVLAWIKNRDSNGILEGLNSLVQAVKAKVRGYRILKNLKILDYLVTGKLGFSDLNTSVVT